MGENFLQMLMGMVDSYLVKHLGLIAISGASVTGNIITIYQAIFLALRCGASVVIQKRAKKIKIILPTMRQVTERWPYCRSALLGGASLLFGHRWCEISLLGDWSCSSRKRGFTLSLGWRDHGSLRLMTTLGSLVQVAATITMLP